MAKRLINDPADFVPEMLEGLVLCHPTVTRLQDVNVIVRADYHAVKDTQVAVISGGGSGHEPAHAGYVGAGMLSAAVPGGVFASPSVSQVLAAIRTVTGPPGCLLVIKNYTGDRINFGLACEQARAEGLLVEMVVVGEDCALADTGIAGRRGLAGTVFVKVAGAAAAAGCPLAVVAAEARAVAAAMGTLGVALSVCTLPGQPTPARLGPGEMEVGLGIHGEPGAQRCPLQPADQCVDRMLTAIAKPVAEGGSGYLPLQRGDAVCLMVANLGATPLSELYIVARRAIQRLEADGIAVVRVAVGPKQGSWENAKSLLGTVTFMPALDMNGASITLLRVSGEGSDTTLGRLDAPTSAAWWPGTFAVPRRCPPPVPAAAYAAPPRAAEHFTSASEETGLRLRAVLTAVGTALVSAESQLTQWDVVVGDGDCGETFRRGAQGVLTGVGGAHPFRQPAHLLLQVADTLRDTMGGTSGVLLDILLRAASTELHHPCLRLVGRPDPEPTVADWLAALRLGVDRVQQYGGGRVGMRTMLDALVPALAAADAAAQRGAAAAAVGAAAAAAARAGAEATKGMAARAGRSSYVGREHLDRVPDPGAMAVAFALEAVAKALAA